MKNNLIIPALIIGLIIGVFLFLGILVDSEINGCYKEEHKKTEEKIVTKIIDGDTIIVSGGENVRLLGIDCDERGKECYTEAKNYIENRLLNQKVILESGEEDIDIYGRELRYIFLNNTNINLEMVEIGLCVARLEGSLLYKQEIQKFEQTAIENKIGCKWN